MRIKQKIIKNNISEELLCITACMVIMAPSIISLFTDTIRSFVILPYKIDTLFIYSLLLMIVFLSLKIILVRSVNLLFYSTILLLLINFLITFFLNKQDQVFFTEIGFRFLVKALPWFFIGFAVRNYKKFKKYIYLSGIIIIVSFFFRVLILKINILEGRSYSQYYTYLMLTSSIIFADAMFNSKKVYDILLFLISSITMLSLGARGPVVCLVLFFVLKIYLTCRSSPKKLIYISVGAVVIGFLTYLFYYDILSIILLLFKRVGLSTRTISVLLEGNFFQDNARVSLITNSIDLLKRNPILGYGIGKDRILLAELMMKMDLVEGSRTLFLEKALGWYPHNIFFEILLHFGVIVGSLAIFSLLSIIYISLIKTSSKDISDTIGIFLGIGLFPLFVSGSYITSREFFMLIGLCLSQYISFKYIKTNKVKFVEEKA